ncbi:hypothetical protein FRB94_001450 [Tulasnella sp. JGI-2019a]|nr:hypothetical protein FRB94_001450 [Tulasnella sp. JGI-2019a]
MEAQTKRYQPITMKDIKSESTQTKLEQEVEVKKRALSVRSLFRMNSNDEMDGRKAMMAPRGAKSGSSRGLRRRVTSTERTVQLYSYHDDLSTAIATATPGTTLIGFETSEHPWNVPRGLRAAFPTRCFSEGQETMAAGAIDGESVATISTSPPASPEPLGPLNERALSRAAVATSALFADTPFASDPPPIVPSGQMTATQGASSRWLAHYGCVEKDQGPNASTARRLRSAAEPATPLPTAEEVAREMLSGAKPGSLAYRIMHSTADPLPARAVYLGCRPPELGEVDPTDEKAMAFWTIPNILQGFNLWMQYKMQGVFEGTGIDLTGLSTRTSSQVIGNPSHTVEK